MRPLAPDYNNLEQLLFYFFQNSGFKTHRYAPLIQDLLGGAQGVKLEEEVAFTETGVEVISLYPFDEALLGREPPEARPDPQRRLIRTPPLFGRST